MSIISLLILTAIPAVQSARESARRNQCENNLRQIGAAALLHHNTLDYFPSGGWGWSWVGNADMGRGKDQPGSWAFNVLDFLEEGNVRLISAGKTGMDKAQATVQLCATPVPLFTCPTRRVPVALPTQWINAQLKTSDEFQLPIPVGAKSDYAINTGDTGNPNPPGPFPRTLEQAKDPNFKWYDVSKYTGISFGRSEIRIADVTDGTSKTYMLGEKAMTVSNYLNGRDTGDNETMYSGFDDDNGRSTFSPPVQDGNKEVNTLFGSAHPGCWIAVFCDGSTHVMTFTIDRNVHRNLGNRADGKTIPADAF
jgi:hypothetical protein